MRWFLALLFVASTAQAEGGDFPDAPAVKACANAPEGMSCVPGGPFIRGSDTGHDAAKPQGKVWVQSFFMDRNEVTYGEYKACEKRRKCDKAGPKYRDFNRPQQPINGVSWFDAVKYCKAHGKHLPTEAEWEKAARGTDGRTFPWGEAPANCDRAVMKTPKLGRSCGVKKRGQHPDTGRVWLVGKKPPTQYGLFDMAGNSYEWVADWYSKSYEKCGAACAGVDPKGPCDGKVPCRGYRRKVVRGGSWYWDAERMTTFYRRAHIPANKPAYHHFGFRCAASVEEATAILSAK